MKTTTAVLLALACTTMAAPAAIPNGKIEMTDALCFNSTLSEFHARRAEKNPGDLDWSTDGCTGFADGQAFHFRPACERHDFGYRNFKAQNRFSDENKVRIDVKFREDMYLLCQPFDGLTRSVCEVFADAGFAAVLAFGRLAKRDTFYEAEAIHV